MTFALLVLLSSSGITNADQARDIFVAIRNNDLPSVRVFVENDPNIISATDQNEMTPLFFAAYYGATPIVEYLIEAGSDTNYRRSNGESALHFAANFDHINVARLLVEHGADIGVQTTNGDTPLRYAINGGAKNVADYLIDLGAAVPASGSLFHVAAFNGMTLVVDRMMKEGVEPDPDDGNGGSILHSAAAGGLIELTRASIARGLDVNQRNRYGTAPIHLASVMGHAEVTSLLIEYGADPNMKMYDGNTPWNLASSSGHKDAADVLSGAGAVPEVVRYMEVPDDMYLGQEPPGLAPLIFAPGIVSNEEWEHGFPSISPAGDEIFWAHNFRRTYATERHGGKWTLPAPADLWTKYGASNPVFSHDGARLFFHTSSTMTGDGRKRDNDIWFVEKTADGWSDPRNLGPNVNSAESDRLVTIAGNGTLYFTSSYDIYRSVLSDGGYQPRERLGGDISTDAIEMSPCVAPDESYLIFESNRPGGYGELELYICFRNADGTWSEPKNMGFTVNRGGSRFPGLTPDAKYLFFVNQRNGNADVYWVDARIVETARRARYSDISSALYRAVDDEGVEAGARLYHELKSGNPSYYDFRESMLNALGYRFMQEGRTRTAAKIFQLNVDAFPGSGNVYDSLGEAYMASGDYQRATDNYSRSLELDPGNDNAVAMLEKIRLKSVSKLSSKELSLERSGQKFEPRFTYQVRLGDIDGDGDLDAVCANMGRSDSRLWINDGNGFFEDSGQRLTRQGHGVELADLDGDGDLDAFITCAGFGMDGDMTQLPSKIYFNDGRGNLLDSQQDLGDENISGNAVDLVDVDVDGDLDAMVVYYQHDNVVYLNDGRGRFSKSDLVYPDNAYPRDLDSDGAPDLFVKLHERGYAVWRNDGSGRFSPHSTIDDPDAMKYGDVGLADLDGDGDTDVIVTNGHFRVGAHASKVLINDGSGVLSDSGQRLPAVQNAGVGVGDLNGDGSPDVVVTDMEKPNRVWINDGKGTLVDSGLEISFGEMFRHVALGDLDNDGDLDLFFANFNVPGRGGPNEIWFNRGSRTGVR
jgi:ankyrin repeat protein/tetratricopeptide (TPR) repeat protein